MWKIVRIACLLACGTLVALPSALAEPVGTGTVTTTMPNFSFTGTLAYDDASYSPFAVPINLGTAVGTATFSGTVTPPGPYGGTFSAQSSAGALSYGLTGNYVGICPSSCECDTPAYAYVSTLDNITGSALAGMPPGVVYTFDGTVHSPCGGAGLSGTFGINAFRPTAVSEGTAVTSSVTTTFFDSGTNQEVSVQVDVTADVSSAGEILVTAHSNAAGAVPSNFALAADGYNAFFFDVTTTATLTPPITVCQHYADADDDGKVDGTTLDETKLAMLHLEGGTFTDVTTSRDTTSNVICGQTAGLSPFVMAVAVPVTPGSLDHFTCYKAGATKGSVKFAGIPIPPGVNLLDAFGPSIVEVKKPQFLCAPTDKNGETPGAELHPEHLEGYQVKNPVKPKPVFPTSIQVIDQFNPSGIRVDAKKQSHLLVPSVKSLTGPTPLPTPGAFSIDHFECYKLAVTKGTPKFAPVLGLPTLDQFGPMTVDVKQPKFLCNPVDKNGENPGAETHIDRLMCYQVKPVKGFPKFATVVGAYVTNQFGSGQLDVKKPSELCVPAMVN